MLDSIIILQQYLATLAGAELAAAKSELINIFRANPWLSILYAGFFRLHDSNPHQFNNLPARSGNFLDPDLTPTNPEGSNSMAVNQATRICTHIKVDGVPCGSPSLRGEVFCYFHQRLIRGVRTPPKSRLHPMAFLEDEASIQVSLMEVVNALVRNTIDFRRGQLILRALHIATKNARQTHFDLWRDKIVTEVPQYPAPVAAKGPEPVLEQASALAHAPRPGLPKLRLPKPVSIAQRPPIEAVVDPTRPKPPGHVITVPVEKAYAANARPGRDPNAGTGIGMKHGTAGATMSGKAAG
jgi:hypothetical protein